MLPTQRGSTCPTSSLSDIPGPAGSSSRRAPDPSVGDLDAAWAELEATAPAESVLRFGRTGGRGMPRGWAMAYLHGETIGCEFADTLPEAIRALTAALREAAR